MKFRGDFQGASKSLEGDLIISFAIDDADINELKDMKDLDIEIHEHKDKRSLNANAYFWKLCDMIAKKLGSDKDTIYKLQLSKYGVFVDVQILTEAVEAMRSQFRYVEELDDGYIGTKIIRCYFGSSGYNTKEMSDLINGTVNDAHDLGIETWDQDQIEALIKAWKGKA